MPKRSNSFQKTVLRIHNALAGTRAVVEESAQVFNHITRTQNEIDVLVSFTVGVTRYRTAIECRQHGRAAGPDWIRDLRTKRDDCRLNKMIAVHAKGFSAAALREAEAHAIDAICLRDAESLAWDDRVIPRGVLVCWTTEAKLESAGFVLTNLSPNRSDPNLSDCTIDFGNGRRADASTIDEHIRRSIARHYEAMRTLHDPLREPSELGTASIPVEFLATVPNGTTVIARDGSQFAMVNASGRATIRLARTEIKDRHLLRYGETSTLEARTTVGGRDFHFTAVGVEGKIQSHALIDGTAMPLTSNELLPMPVFIRAVNDPRQ